MPVLQPGPARQHLPARRGSAPEEAAGNGAAAGEYEFAILGPLRAGPRGPGPVPVLQPRARSALAVLLLRANQPCDSHWLREAVWEPGPPHSRPMNAVHVCMNRLRAALGPFGGRLQTVGARSNSRLVEHGYQMTVMPGELDTDEFRGAYSRALTELDVGDPAEAARILDRALALWGEPPLPTLPGTEAVQAITAELLEQRDHAGTVLIDARIAAGDYDLVLPRLRAAASARRAYRERTHIQLMLALYLSGRREDALAAYTDARAASLRELAAPPGPELVQLHRQILTEDAGLRQQGRPRREAIRAITPPGFALQCPAPPPDFTGRADELRRIVMMAEAQGVPVTVISGPPGSGTSALAACAAQDLRGLGRFPGGQLYADLGGPGAPLEPADILADVLQSLGVPAGQLPASVTARASMYRSLLGRTKVLVLADNAAAAAQVQPLIPGTAGSAVIVASHLPLAGLPGAQAIRLGPLSDDDAFAIISPAAGPERIAGEPAAIAALILACSGNPAALRRAAAAIAEDPEAPLSAEAAAMSSPGMRGTAGPRMPAAGRGLERALGQQFRKFHLTHDAPSAAGRNAG